MGRNTAARKYSGKVRIGTDENGKPIFKYVTANSKRELENAKAAIREHYVYGEPLPPDKPFYEYAEEWYRLKKYPFISDSCRASYKSCFINHVLPEFGLQNLKAISAQQIQAFINGFAGRSKSQITLVIGLLKKVFASAYAEGFIERDPTVALVRPRSQKQTERRPLTADETKRILKTMRTHPEGLLLAVLYYLGVRRGEALGLKWSDFDWDSDQVHIQRDIDYNASKAREGTLKTDAADRYIPVPPELKRMLLRRLDMERQGAQADESPLSGVNRAGSKNYVFHDQKGDPLPQVTFQRVWCRLMENAGCAEARKFDPTGNNIWDIRKQVKPLLTPHYFRHNYVTLLYEAGVDPLIAMKIVGHTDYQTTANIYTHVRDEMLRKATVNLDEVFGRRAEGE